jgi:hypothetical protein
MYPDGGGGPRKWLAKNIKKIKKLKIVFSVTLKTLRPSPFFILLQIN